MADSFGRKIFLLELEDTGVGQVSDFGEEQ
jgi:hypothetical protein